LLTFHTESSVGSAHGFIGEPKSVKPVGESYTHFALFCYGILLISIG